MSTSETTRKQRVQARKRIGELKRRRKTKDKRKQMPEKSLLSRATKPAVSDVGGLNETLMSRLDLSCLMRARRKGPIKAPSVVNAYPPRYARRKNVLPPFNRYLVAVYVCLEEFVLEDSMVDRLFCSEATWLGPVPKCVKKGETVIDNVRRCDQERGGCEQVCEDTPTGAKCSCFDGFRINATNSCIDVNECDNVPRICPEDTNCENTVGSYKCINKPKKMTKVLQDEDYDAEDDEDDDYESLTELPEIGKCEDGYKKDENGNCVDINECVEGDEGEAHGCEHECTNEEDIDECASGICKTSRCVNTPGSYRCECDEGYRSDGDTCVDIDECVEGSPCRERCLNTPGSYRCACSPGFRLQGGECVDINECEWRNGRCDQECVNTVGSFVCACRSGYVLDHRNRSQCQDVNECLNRNGDCNGECINTPGSYYCTCSDDLVLSPDERSCVPLESKCRAMEPPLHGEVRCPGHYSGASDYPHGARCHIRCRRGFKLEGPHTRYCVNGGRWNGKEPACLREYPIVDSRYDPDMPRPFVRCPQDMDVELPARQNTIRVSFPQPKSNMNWWRYVDASPTWAKQLQADLPAGTTVVTFTAWSPVSNYTSTCRIVIRVRDTENPKVSTCPTSFEVRLSPGEPNRLIFWQEPTFTDNVGVERIYKTREPGQLMYPGVHNVRYIASDAAGNQAECHFSVHVRESDHRQDSEPRIYRRRMLMCPGRPPQPMPTSAYGWQIPSGCYLRYTRIFSGAYAVQRGYREHRQNGYQDARAAYHEIHPVQRNQPRAPPRLPSMAYPVGDSEQVNNQSQLSVIGDYCSGVNLTL
ncbi:hypothetical protein KPH14_004248 [Odynerus spinipes]|uniref:Uncharacterized protein n=1 Tax=Odynerus spinipes TaxID=1348599 RepID=A0AAD9VV67_9HYME|nr:hypothetical protein KPH14_004248 [Odynerus spinipes]